MNVLDAKSAVPDELVALFQESDRVIRSEAESGYVEILYRASREIILSRLALLGCTEATVAEKFEKWKIEQKQISVEYEDEAAVKALETFDQSVWRARARRMLDRQSNQRTEPADEIDQHMQDRYYGGWLHFGGYGSLVTIRAILDAFSEVQDVTLDISDLVHGG